LLLLDASKKHKNHDALQQLSDQGGLHRFPEPGNFHFKHHCMFIQKGIYALTCIMPITTGL